MERKLADPINMDHCAVWESTHSGVNFLHIGIFKITFRVGGPFFPHYPGAEKVDNTYHVFNYEEQR